MIRLRLFQGETEKEESPLAALQRRRDEIAVSDGTLSPADFETLHAKTEGISEQEQLRLMNERLAIRRKMQGITMDPRPRVRPAETMGRPLSD